MSENRYRRSIHHCSGACRVQSKSTAAVAWTEVNDTTRFQPNDVWYLSRIPTVSERESSLWYCRYSAPRTISCEPVGFLRTNDTTLGSILLLYTIPLNHYHLENLAKCPHIFENQFTLYLKKNSLLFCPQHFHWATVL